MDEQTKRAIRRAIEAASHIRRPADWTEIDYVRVQRTLEDNGFQLTELEPKKESKRG
jgi:transposase-like protein